MTGFTPSIPYPIRRRNEIISLLTLFARHPNRYWLSRLLCTLGVM